MVFVCCGACIHLGFPNCYGGVCDGDSTSLVLGSILVAFMDSSSGRDDGVQERATELVIEVLGDDEEEVSELEVVAPEKQVLSRLSLLVWVLGTKHVNPQAFSNLMGSKRDRQEVMEVEVPWFFEKRAVVLKEVTCDEVIANVELNEVPIWVQIHNFPWNQCTLTNVTTIATKAGRFLAFDERGEQGWGRFTRARILMHVEKPIRKSVMMRTGSGGKVEVTFRYEGLSKFCYMCGKMDHLMKECERRTEDFDEEERTTYGECKAVGGPEQEPIMGSITSPHTLSGSEDVVVEQSRPEKSSGDRIVVSRDDFHFTLGLVTKEQGRSDRKKNLKTKSRSGNDKIKSLDRIRTPLEHETMRGQSIEAHGPGAALASNVPEDLESAHLSSKSVKGSTWKRLTREVGGNQQQVSSKREEDRKRKD
ncbi:hypothetical protein Tsubulata_047003 [Turnera subulata]|uniref:CCHC-type domain-containing protein n=1 Tax=Turnera subulata TaxID=218843 RepID=A0A9Q0G279_9ROSI|nr:hypothetical protein Tsubulata_047003 [Turnera subulata]